MRYTQCYLWIVTQEYLKMLFVREFDERYSPTFLPINLGKLKVVSFFAASSFRSKNKVAQAKLGCLNKCLRDLLGQNLTCQNICLSFGEKKSVDKNIFQNLFLWLISYQFKVTPTISSLSS